MVYKKGFKKFNLWYLIDWKHFGLGFHVTKYVPFSVVEYKLSIKIPILFLLLIIDIKKTDKSLFTA